MLHHNKSPFNMNYTPLSKLAEIFKDKINHIEQCQIGLRNAAKLYLSDVTDFAKTLEEIRSFACGEELIELEDRFNELLEDFLGTLDPILHIYFWDPQLVLINYDVTKEEALDFIPEYKAAVSLLPKPEEPDTGLVNLFSGETFGNIWEYEDLCELFAWLPDQSCVEPMAFLNLTDLCVGLIACWQKIEKLLDDSALRAKLLSLRNLRTRMHLIYLFVHMELYPDIPYRTESTLLDPQNFALEPLYAKNCRQTLAEFSCNDLSHTAFLRYIQEMREAIDTDDMAPGIFANLEKALSKYKAIVAKFSLKEWWDEYEEQETIFLSNFEQTMLAIQFAAGTFDHLDEKRYEEFKNGPLHLAAVELWEALPTFVFSSLYMPQRGSALHMLVWKEMRVRFQHFQFEQALTIVGGWDSFIRALTADNDNIRLLQEEGEELLPLHKELRDQREYLTAIAGISPYHMKKNVR